MTGEKSVILIDDEETMLRSLQQWLDLSGFSVKAFSDANEALSIVAADFSGVIVSDIKMPKMDGMTLLSQVKTLDKDIPVVLMTGHGDVPIAVDAMKRGAYDFLEKPFSPERLAEAVARAHEQRALLLENRALKKRLSDTSGLSRYLIGESDVMRNLRAELTHLATTDVDVLLLGETGTGKELVARALHDFGARAQNRFQPVNCGAIPDDLFESEFFGHKAGAFTGAGEARIGALEYADKGTIFLDEVTSLSVPMQVKLLRVLQERKIHRLGGNELKDVDMRVISAANENVNEAIKDGRFRDDFYYRINTIELRLPSLRERGDDILLLFQHFVDVAEKQFERKAPQLKLHDHVALTAHDWPGNVRELKNVAERFVLARNTEPVDLERLIKSKPAEANNGARGLPLAEQMAAFEKQLIERSLKQNEGNISAVMEELHLPRRTLNDKMNRYGLVRDKI